MKLFDLEPCPFCCCKEPKLSKHSRRHPDFPFRVKCPDCGARTDWCSIALVAAESWNNRHINDKMVPDKNVGKWLIDEQEVGGINGETQVIKTPYCSSCETPSPWKTNFCPNCGMKMEVNCDA